MMTFDEYMESLPEARQKRIEAEADEIIADIKLQQSDNNTNKMMTHREYLASLPKDERRYIEEGTKAILAKIEKSQNGVKRNDDI